MSKNFLFILLSLSVAGLLWGAQGGSADGAIADNNGSSASKVQIGGGEASPPIGQGVIQVPYWMMRTASRMPMRLLRTFAWLPRRVAKNVQQSMGRLMVAFRDYATDILGYLASSERTELIRVHRDVPVLVTGSRPKPPARGINLMRLMFNLFTYPMKIAYRTTVGLIRFSPLAGTLNLSSSLLENSAVLFRNPIVGKMANVTRHMADYAAAMAWNFTKINVLPRLDGFVNNLKDSGTLPESLLALLIELQTLYHIFKFLGMA